MESFLNRLEQRFGGLAMPGLIRYLAVIFFITYLAGAFRPEAGQLMDFDWEKIKEGELWRLVTFAFAPYAGSGFGLFGLLFAFFGMLLSFIFSDGLEEVWGVFRTNLFILWGYLSALLGVGLCQWFFGLSVPGSGVFLGMSVLFALPRIFRSSPSCFS